MPNQPEMVDVPFTVSFEEGSLRSVFPVPAGETNLTQLLPVLQHFTSGITDRLSQSAAQHGRPVTCGPKCGACCRQLVPISPFEAEALAGWIASLPPEQQQALAARFYQACLALQERGVLARLTPDMFSLPGEQYKEVDTHYFSAGVACPFLVEESCSIHPIRPVVCREYIVVSPPEYCAEPGHPRAQVVVLPVRPSKALMALGKRVEGDAQGWLPLILLFHWMRAGIRPSASVSGTGPAVLEQFLNALGRQEGTTVQVDAQAPSGANAEPESL